MMYDEYPDDSADTADPNNSEIITSASMEVRMERNASFTSAPPFQPPPPSLQDNRRCFSER